ncbi:hypothetical protein K449DRAFT_424677 [Hypoxylon sp. EC38]|nr:hypothetical protein K449DRAFT_424677 [Hypoxylon sp. EC38]
MTSQGDTAPCPDLIDDFKLIYADKTAAIGQHVQIVTEILNSGIGDGAFRAIPVTARIKELDSAQKSLRRRQAARMERQNLRERMRHMHGDWGQYWKDLGREQMINDYGPFKDQESMIHALHDLGGVRVCVYFPDDVEKVVSFLKRSGRVKILQTTQKTQGDEYMDKLRSYVNLLENVSTTSNRPRLNNTFPVSEKLFPGYRATHLVVELLGDAIPKYYEDKHYKVEVQIGTVVMHAWSQIEHDIIYKPGDDEPSDDEKRVLDLFNGIVMSGEAALKQLAASTARKEIDRGGKPDEQARNHYEFGVWLTSYCDIKGLHPQQEVIAPAWNKLDKVLGILRSSGDDKSGKVRELLDKVYGSPEENHAVFGNDLPLYLLRAKVELAINSISQFSTSDVSAKQQTRVAARHLAFRVVHSINMASYLGVMEDFIATIEKMLSSLDKEKRPSLIDFLDLLHPEHPQVNHDGNSEDDLIDFCDAFLEYDKLKEVVEDSGKLLRMQLPILLTDIGFIVSPIGNIMRGPDVPTVVPRALCRILYDPEHTNWIPEIFHQAPLPRVPRAQVKELGSSASRSASRLRSNAVDSQPASPTTAVTSLSYAMEGPNVQFTEEVHKGGMKILERQLEMSPKPQELMGRANELFAKGGIGGAVRLSFESPYKYFYFRSAEGNIISMLECDLTQVWRTANGYFEPIRSNPPTWRYVDKGPNRWIVYKLSPSKFIPAQQTIQRLRRKSQWVDFANRLRPGCCAAEKEFTLGSPREYTFQMDGSLFTVKNLEHTYELAQTFMDFDNTRLESTEAGLEGHPASVEEVSDEDDRILSDTRMTERGTEHGEETNDFKESQIESEP